LAVVKIGLVPLREDPSEGDGVGDGEADELSGPDAAGLVASSPVQAASSRTATEQGTATRASLNTVDRAYEGDRGERSAGYSTEPGVVVCLAR
jgi:hypothetical protein